MFSNRKQLAWHLTLFSIIFCLSNVNTRESIINTEDTTDSEEDYDYDGSVHFEDPSDTWDDAIEYTLPHYALDHSMTKRLALMEQDLVESLSNILEEMPKSMETDLCSIHLNKYLGEFQQDSRAVKGQSGEFRAIVVTENPNLSYKMIRRMVVTLLNSTVGTCKDSYPTVVTTIHDIFIDADLSPPRWEDLDDALLGILRIQYVYGLNATKEIRLGNLNGVSTSAFLYFDDCLALAKKAIEIGADAMAYQWLVSAPLRSPEIQSPQEYVNDEDRLDLETTSLELVNLTLAGTLDGLHDLLKNKRQESLGGYHDYSVYATCRGQTILPAEFRHQMFCFYEREWDWYLAINPLKIEILHEDPVILQLYDFVGDETAAFIRESGSSSMTRFGMDSFKTSMHSWAIDTEELQEDSKMVKLNREIEIFMGLLVRKKGASSMQVELYGSLGGYYDFRNDAFPDAAIPYHGDTGGRIATLQMFLSDVLEGGYTVFPQLGIYAEPVKGSALIWYPLKLNGQEDERTQHGGCPVVLGVKEVANQWILQYENMFKHPCSRDRNQ